MCETVVVSRTSALGPWTGWSDGLSDVTQLGFSFLFDHDGCSLSPVRTKHLLVLFPHSPSQRHSQTLRNQSDAEHHDGTVRRESSGKKGRMQTGASGLLSDSELVLHSTS